MHGQLCTIILLRRCTLEMAHFFKLFLTCVLSLFFWAETVSGYYGFNQTNVCCDGVVADLTMLCCGKGRVFNIKEDLCCNQTIVKLPAKNKEQYSCCPDSNYNYKAYNYKTSVCCPGGAVLEKSDPSDSNCCGAKQVYDSNRSICCNDEVISRSSEKACCGEKLIYEPAKQLCASYFDIQKKQFDYRVKDILDNNTKSCDLELYDVRKQACCAGINRGSKVVPNEKGLRYPICCWARSQTGDVTTTEPKVFDPRSQVCCESGLVLNLPESQWGRFALCCGETISYINQTCCNGKIFEGRNAGSCCGDQLIREKNQFCCDGKGVAQSASADLSCCATDAGERVYNVTATLCCGSRLSDRTSLYQGCCFPANAPYNSLTQVCLARGIVQLDIEEKERVQKLCGPTFILY